MTEDQSDIIIIGAGIAGVSAAAALSEHASVRIVEMEAQAGYHSSGRSAAFFSPPYGNAIVRAFTVASENFFRSPPAGFCEHELIHPRDCLFIARESQSASLEKMSREIPSLEYIQAGDVLSKVPVLKPDELLGGLLDESGGDLDVNELLQSFLRQFRHNQGKIENSERVEQMHWQGGLWHVRTGKNTFKAPVVVNAAGAWADGLAQIAGLANLGIEPKRRTAVLVDPPDNHDIKDWPLCIDIDEQFYFKPDAGQLLISPADETPSEACDAQADEYEVALAVDRFENATGLEIGRIKHKWAGLRSFASDRTFVLGFDPRCRGFFWLAGQGGYGVQTAPAMARLCASLLLKNPLEGPYVSIQGLADEVSPERFLN